MKRIVCLALVLSLMILPCAYAKPLSGDDIGIDAPSAILMEKQTGTVLYEKDADKRLSPASVTKIMTMLLIVEAIESGKTSLDSIVTASERAASFGGSCVYLEEGEQMSVSEMLKCIAVVSANDCAVAMSEFLCGSEEQFVKRMNARAAELKMQNTHFTNCTGLFDDSEHYTSARDIAIMSRELIKHDMIKEYTTIWMDSIRDGEFELTNTNRLVKRYAGCTGLKTGYTSGAMYCLSATAEREGREFIAVVMHCGSIDSRNADAAKLLDYAFANFAVYPRTDGQPPVLSVELGRAKTVRTRYAGDEYVLSDKGRGEAKYALTVPERLRAPVREGDSVGILTVTIDGKKVDEIDVIAAETVEKLSFFGIFALLAGSIFAM